MVRNLARANNLDLQYHGPFKVTDMSNKTVTVQEGDKSVKYSIDRCVPATVLGAVQDDPDDPRPGPSGHPSRLPSSSPAADLSSSDD